MLRAEIHLDGAAVQLEANVALDCESDVMSTGGFANSLGQPARVIRIMSPGWASAHKLSAWNERRLLRDLYDCYFFVARLNELPDISQLKMRLAKVHSRIPSLANRKSMLPTELAAELRATAAKLGKQDLENELGGILPQEEMAGLATRMKAATNKLTEWLESLV